MSGSRLGRGRGGRLAVYAGCGAVVILLVLAYRAAVSEMATLRELHEQCAHHQESLAAQLQVIFEYKVRLEKSLADEKSANAAVKQELQQRATREKTIRDKNTVEAMQRYNSLEQEYKTLQTEHQDLQEVCNNRQKQALEESMRLETKLQELRSELKQAKEDKVHSLEHLKNKYLEIENDKAKIEQENVKLVKANEEFGVKNQHLEKEVIQLNRELDEVKKSCDNNPGPTLKEGFVSPAQSSPGKNEPLKNVESGIGGQGAGANSQNAMNLARPPSQEQSTSTSLPKIQPSTGGGGEILSNNKMEMNKVATQNADKSHAALRPQMKVPFGVLPIPNILEDVERKPEETAKVKVEDKKIADLKELSVDKESQQGIIVEQKKPPPADIPRPPGQGRHNGDKSPGWMFQRNVPPGIQEIGDEPNNLDKIPGFEDMGNQQVGDGVEYGQYGGGDYDKEPQLRNNEHLGEGEEEGEDEDDPIDYDENNMKVEKHHE